MNWEGFRTERSWPNRVTDPAFAWRGSSVGIMWIPLWVIECAKSRRVSGAAERLSSSQGGLCSSEWLVKVPIAPVTIAGQLEIFLFLFGAKWKRIHYYWGHYRPIVPAPYDDGWSWVWSNRWNAWQGKPKYSEKTCSYAVLSTRNPTLPCSRSNSGLRGRSRWLTAPATARPNQFELGNFLNDISLCMNPV
jgi:hypothetical protein